MRCMGLGFPQVNLRKLAKKSSPNPLKIARFPDSGDSEGYRDQNAFFTLQSHYTHVFFRINKGISVTVCRCLLMVVFVAVTISSSVLTRTRLQEMVPLKRFSRVSRNDSYRINCFRICSVMISTIERLDLWDTGLVSLDTLQKRWFSRSMSHRNICC